MNDTERSPWSNPVMWLLVGLPVVSMIFGIGLVIIASRDSDDAIVDKVQRTGQMQTADVAPDAVAGQRELSAVVRIGKGTVDVIPVKGDFDRHASLKLSLLHPAHASGDAVLTLAPSETGWHAQHEVDLGSEWNLRLEPADSHWRIAGRLPKGQRAVLLQPAFGSGR